MQSIDMTTGAGPSASETETPVYRGTLSRSASRFRKAGFIGVLLTGIVPAAAKLMGEGPQWAGAAIPVVATVSATTPDLISESAANLRLRQQTLADSEKLLAHLQADPGKAQIALADLKRNPFRASAGTGVSDNGGR